MAARKTGKIARVSVVDQVFEELKAQINEGVYPVGSKLPSETELSDQFGVNRLSVRMALQKLSTLGLIETRVGEGTYIQDFSLKPVFSEIASIYDAKSNLEDVVQLRVLLETECAVIACKNATDEELKELKAVLDIYISILLQYISGAHTPEQLDMLAGADFNYHYALIKLSKNQLYKDIYFMAYNIIREHIKSLLKTRCATLLPEQIEISDMHARQLNAIMSRDEARVRAICREIIGITD